MDAAENTDKRVSADDLIELVNLFEGFSQASTVFAQSYRALEGQIAQLSSQLEEQVRLLRRTEGFLTSVLANVPAGILVLDMDGIITLFNTYAEQLTGLKAHNIIGQPYVNIFNCQITEPDSPVYTLTTGSMIESKEKELKIVDGNHLPVRFSTSWIIDEKNDKTGVLEVFEDLRVLRDMQERMQQSANLASLGEMAAQVAHELRNPLAGVQGFAQFLEEDIPKDDPVRPTVDRIVQGVKEIDLIAGRLLEFTNPICPMFEKIDLVHLLKEETELIEAEVRGLEKDIEFVLKVPEESVPVTCDPQLLKQAVLNLLKNSIYACKHECRVEISLSWDLLRNRVRISIDDTGEGIAAENLEKIFSPFFTTRIKGTGLGLSIVKKIIDVHHGEIKVQSELDKGSQFELVLPITRLT